MSNAIRVAKLCDIPNHGQLAAIASGTPLLLFRHEDKVFVLDDICTHTGDSLAGGEVEGFVVTCPWHGAQFDIRTGKNLRMPALCPTGAYEAWVEDGHVIVRLGE